MPLNRKLNNKGYMLVEIILAFVLAVGVAYFMTDLTIKLKNKNDDLMVRTLVATDQAIIYNTLMKSLYKDAENFNCSNIVISPERFEYKNFTNIMNEYSTVGSMECKVEGSIIEINIPISVKQLPDENFDVKIKHKII